MPSFNKVILMGNLTRDPETKTLPNGMAVVSIGLAVNDRYKDKQDQWVDRPSFIDCGGFGRTAENIGKYFTKGKPILIEGKLRMDQWEDKNTGQKRSKLKVVIDRFEFVGGRNDGDGGGQQSFQGGGGYTQKAAPATAPAGPQHQPVHEDDIPF